MGLRRTIAKLVGFKVGFAGRAIKGRRTLPRLLPGLVLHRPDGGYTEVAETILRDAAPLDLKARSA